MSKRPPSSLSVEDAAQISRELLHALAAESHLVYLSAPLTTGRTFSSKSGPPVEKTSQAARNRATAGANARELRKLECWVLDPTEFGEIRGWSQTDYYSFWAQVIVFGAKKVVFAKDWEWSRGCAFEFLTAAEAGIPCFTLDLSRLDPLDGLAILQVAVSEMQSSGIATDFHEEVIRRLIELTRRYGKELR